MSDFFDQDDRHDLPPDDFGFDPDHDPATCPNCMKFMLLDRLDDLGQRVVASYACALKNGTYAFTSDEWATIFKNMRLLIDMSEAAVAGGLGGTPFPFDKYTAEESGDETL